MFVMINHNIKMRRILSIVLSLAMLISLMAFGAYAEETSGSGSYVLESRDLEAFAAGAKKDGDTTNAADFFTIIWSAKSKIDGSEKTWDDGYTSAQRINFGGGAAINKNSVKFTTAGAATVKIWWVAGDANRQMTILDSNGTSVAATSGETVKNSAYLSELEITEAGTYYLGGSGSNNYIFKIEVIPAAQTYTLESKDLEAFAAGAKKDGDTTNVADFFTIIWSAKSKVDTSNKTWDDGYTSGQRINFGGKAATEKNAVKFTTAGAATVKIWWVAGGDDRPMAILDGTGASAAVTTGEVKSSGIYISELEIAEAGTYYLGGSNNNNYIFKVEVTTGKVEKPPRADWSEIPAPSFGETDPVALSAASADTIVVNVNAVVGYDGADKVYVVMKDAAGAVIDTQSSGREAEQHTLSFKPTASGTYTFSVYAVRAEEENHECAENVKLEFTLPLVTPYIKSAANAGGGSVTLEWESVPEAEKYVVSVNGTDKSVETDELTATVTGLTVGETYSIAVKAVRGQDESESAEARVTVTNEAETVWSFSAFGTGIDAKNNGYSGKANDGSVRVYSKGGKGKLVPASTDGLSFYYTKVDPKTTNFKLTAVANVNEWTYSNGQEGFGLMAADAVGKNGDSATFWNNSYMASVTKVEFTIDGVKNSMKLGVGSQEKIGVTSDNINAASQLDDMSKFSSTMTTLDTSCLEKGAGTYNLVGKFTNASAPDGTIENPLTSFKLTIEKNNTGYFVSYTNPEGITTTQKYYDTEALSKLDPDSVYVGFFASRNADIEFTDISFTTSDPATDPEAEERPMAEVEPSFIVESAAFSSKSNYTLVYYGNADGVLSVRNSAGSEIYNKSVTAKTKVHIPVTLSKGTNTITLTMTPDKSYKPSEYEILSSYEPVTFAHNVIQETNNQKVVYVSPNGTDAAAGTKEEPQSITAAVRRAIPGQTIILTEGTYKLSDKLVIERGIDGTASNNINLFADPDAKTRPVLDFGQNSAGIVIGGSYWHFKGFDVTNSKNGEKGIQVSGNNNTLELLETYKNGNTGIQIARFKGTDARDEWPKNNLILNCTSYLNADKGYEDADGFAAKLTIGEGNVFDGCIAHHNADDGWDLYAKIENGPIGKVIIRNSVAYKNGYILDASGKEINAGNGNGFKMGGESISGYHTLINSVAFANKSKGIDSNSCPDIQAIRSTSFDNESYNVAFYTNTAVNTDFSADGIISFKKSNSVGENIKPVGSQNTAKIYGETNYYFNGTKSLNSTNAEVKESWFKSLDTAAAINGGITRNGDGSINMNGYLELTDEAPANAGARLVGRISAEFTDGSHIIITGLPADIADPIATVINNATGKTVAENAKMTDGRVTVYGAVTGTYTVSVASANYAEFTATASYTAPAPVETPSSTEITTTTNDDGSVTSVEKTGDGGTVTTTKSADGAVVKETQAADGSSVVESSTPGGSTGEVKLNADGTLASAEATVGARDFEKALENNAPVQIPVTVPVASDAEGEAVAVKITLPEVEVKTGSVAALPEVEIQIVGGGSGTVAYVKNEDGSLTLIRECRPGSIILPVDSSCEIVIADNTQSFDDVAADDWFAENVTFTAARKIFNGWESKFSPNELMYRSMAAQVLYNYDRYSSAGDGTVFDDVKASDWFSGAVGWAHKIGIVYGFDGKFGADEAISRQDFVTMLFRYAEKVGFKVDGKAELSAFTDASEISDYALEAMKWAVNKGILVGFDGKLNPKSGLRRCEAAAIMQRFVMNAR